VRILISILLSTILLSGNLGLSFTTQYCFGFAVKSVLVFGDNIPNCGMEDPYSCEESDEESIRRKSCCENRSSNFLLVDDQLHSEEIDFPNLQIAERVPESFSLPKPATTENSRILLLNLDLPPPDRQSLFQVYTI